MYDGSKLHLASKPPDSVMPSDECLVADHYEGEIVNENYTKVQEKREEALRSLNGNVHVIVNKENIVQDLISIHSFFFIRMLFFPAQAEYSYFAVDFRLKIFLYYS